MIDATHGSRVRSRFVVSVVTLAVLVAAALLTRPAASAITARAANAQQCREPALGPRDPGNPLGLSRAPGADPLTGAHFYVPGPAHGAAASAIATALGVDPHSLSDSLSWASFHRSLTSGRLHARLTADRGLRYQVDELSKLAAQPEVQRISAYSMGGGPGAIFAQAEKVICHNRRADPGSIPLINTYFLHPLAGSCPTAAALQARASVFRGWVDELAAAIDRRPAVMLLETDGLGSTGCIKRVGALPQWEAMLRYEIGRFAALPHVVAYVEGGYSDSNSVGYTARALNAIGVGRIRGFYTNDTHQQWTIKEARWARAISRRTHGAHFIVNTAQNGRGPLLNPHPTVQGVEDLCNPPGRGTGPRLTTATGFPGADAWMWTSPPGNSSGCGGGPPGGVFWPARAIGLAARANGRLGPGFPSQPY